MQHIASHRTFYLSIPITDRALTNCSSNAANKSTTLKISKQLCENKEDTKLIIQKFKLINYSNIYMKTVCIGIPVLCHFTMCFFFLIKNSN